MLFEEFQLFGRRCGLKNVKLAAILDWNRTILAILNFYNTPLPPIMFKPNQTYRSIADVIWRFSRAAMVAILDIRTEPF